MPAAAQRSVFPILTSEFDIKILNYSQIGFEHFDIEKL